MMHFLLFIFCSSALESLSNCIESSAIMEDFLSAVSSSVILLTSLFTLPLIISSSSITLELKASTFVLALYSFIRSSIFTFSLSLSFGILWLFYIQVALLKKDEARDIDDDYLEISSICVYYLFYAAQHYICTILPAVPDTICCIFKLYSLNLLQSLQCVFQLEVQEVFLRGIRIYQDQLFLPLKQTISFYLIVCHDSNMLIYIFLIQFSNFLRLFHEQLKYKHKLREFAQRLLRSSRLC